MGRAARGVSMHVMHSWESLTIAEQTLMRRGISGYPLAGMDQNYGVALRWAGATEAPRLRSYTEDEQRTLVPQLAAVGLDLAERGPLTVYEGESHRASALSWWPGRDCTRSSPIRPTGCGLPARVTASASPPRSPCASIGSTARIQLPTPARFLPGTN